MGRDADRIRRFEGDRTNMGVFARRMSDALRAENGDAPTDARLLESFLATRDETAFATLVQRHGPMVMGVCARVLREPRDAEDAFQATFLVLVRKAASISPPGMVGNWLYGVAYQTALKARAMADRRGARERQVVGTPEPAVIDPDDALWRELRPIIDDELSRLPDKYRAPLVLCDIEEKSYKEAAEQLGWPEGTVAGRLSRARAMLAARLARRGVVLSAVALPLLLTHNAATASVPAALTTQTVQAATLLAAGQATAGAASANVVALTDGVVNAMTLTKLKIAAVVLLGACLAVAGVGFAFTSAEADRQEQKKTAQPQAPALPAAPKAEPKNGNGAPKLGNNQNGNGKNEPNGKNNQQGKNEPNGDNNQKGKNEPDGNNNQKGKNEPNGDNNQKGKNEKNGPNGNNPQGKNEKNGNNNQNGNGQKNG